MLSRSCRRLCARPSRCAGAGSAREQGTELGRLRARRRRELAAVPAGGVRTRLVRALDRLLRQLVRALRFGRRSSTLLARRSDGFPVLLICLRTGCTTERLGDANGSSARNRAPGWWSVTNEKARRVLGWSPRSRAEGILASAERLLQLGQQGGEALALAAERPFDMIFLDVQMPGMDGHQTQEELNARGIRFPVLILTGMGDIDRLRIGLVGELRGKATIPQARKGEKAPTGSTAAASGDFQGIRGPQLIRRGLA